MFGYLDVQRLLDEAVDGEAIGAHRAFWRSLSRDEFVATAIYGYPLVALADGNSSMLIKALRGEAPFGSDLGVSGATMPRMPADRTAMAGDRIQQIATWIDESCPE